MGNTGKEAVQLDWQGPVAIVSINRPDQRNALNRFTVKNLRNEIESLSEEKKCHCIILRGVGEKAFCSGADIKELLEAESPEDRKEFFGEIAELLIAIEECEKPVIALIHGYALAGGCGLAASCDLVYASSDAILGLPEIQIGLLPLIVLSPLMRVVEPRALYELVISGKRINATRAKEIGLITEIFPEEKLDEEVLAIARNLSELSPLALQTAKRFFSSRINPDYVESLRSSAEEVAAFSLHGDVREGISAFFEKRKPIWNGK